ncbi:hypothetical protein QYE76_045729 [Lolium multiflorum]|uniref:Uncharacterized protein n=1 Tax=Lolium multiflorum TaxID=4521 RepID=A0AAD8TNL0_LOLMU|nr:hypothetical protein QYE76_045729 [Lolium multiflorum]
MDLQPSLSCSIFPSNESSTSALIHLAVLVIYFFRTCLLRCRAVSQNSSRLGLPPSSEIFQYHVGGLPDALTGPEFTGDLIHYLYQVEDVQNMKSELTNLEVKLKEAEKLIMKLREEARTTIQKHDKFWHEMELYARTRRFMPRLDSIP